MKIFANSFVKFDHFSLAVFQRLECLTISHLQCSVASKKIKKIGKRFRRFITDNLTKSNHADGWFNISMRVPINSSQL